MCATVQAHAANAPSSAQNRDIAAGWSSENAAFFERSGVPETPNDLAQLPPVIQHAGARGRRRRACVPEGERSRRLRPGCRGRCASGCRSRCGQPS